MKCRQCVDREMRVVQEGEKHFAVCDCGYRTEVVKRITPEEWNKLTEDEKMKRIENFHNHMEEYREKGIPTGMSDLRRLAVQYGTPIPRLDKNFDSYFEDFKLPLGMTGY